jgi:hypothetical protein
MKGVKNKKGERKTATKRVREQEGKVSSRQEKQQARRRGEETKRRRRSSSKRE